MILFVNWYILNGIVRAVVKKKRSLHCHRGGFSLENTTRQSPLHPRSTVTVLIRKATPQRHRHRSTATKAPPTKIPRTIFSLDRSNTLVMPSQLLFVTWIYGLGLIQLNRSYNVEGKNLYYTTKSTARILTFLPSGLTRKGLCLWTTFRAVATPVPTAYTIPSNLYIAARPDCTVLIAQLQLAVNYFCCLLLVWFGF